MMITRALVFGAILLVNLAATPGIAQIANIEAITDPAAISLYSDDRTSNDVDEVWTKIGPMTAIRNVTRPTLTPILPPKVKATGAAVIIAPGGGMIFLAMPDPEITRKLVDRGIAVFILKYRVVRTPTDVTGLMGVFKDLQARSKDGEVVLPNPEGGADAQAAVAMVRTNAAKWHIDPAKVGLLGFSSGARIARAAALSTRADGRPAFVGLVFGAMDAAAVPPTAPPMFAAIAIDDTTVPNVGFQVVESWRAARRPVELHAYGLGGHGFNGGGPYATHRLYLDQFVAWLVMSGFQPAPKP